jgi:hypothetical protein
MPLRVFSCLNVLEPDEESGLVDPNDALSSFQICKGETNGKN